MSKRILITLEDGSQVDVTGVDSFEFSEDRKEVKPVKVDELVKGGRYILGQNIYDKRFKQGDEIIYLGECDFLYMTSDSDNRMEFTVPDSPELFFRSKDSDTVFSLDKILFDVKIYKK